MQLYICSVHCLSLNQIIFAISNHFLHFFSRFIPSDRTNTRGRVWSSKITGLKLFKAENMFRIFCRRVEAQNLILNDHGFKVQAGSKDGSIQIMASSLTGIRNFYFHFEAVCATLDPPFTSEQKIGIIIWDRALGERPCLLNHTKIHSL